jgi:hypothetical protein
MVKLSNSWIIMNPGGPPTPDKPGISVVDYQPGNTTSIFLNLRIADIQACYQDWKAKGAEFVTPPIDPGAEIRCYMRDLDGYLIEVGQSTGLLHRKLAAKRPEDLPGSALSSAGETPASKPPSANLRWCQSSWGVKDQPRPGRRPGSHVLSRLMRDSCPPTDLRHPSADRGMSERLESRRIRRWPMCRC